MDNEKTFEHKLENWLQEVLQNGNEYGRQIGLDFYPFQCSYNSLKPSVDLLIIGTNPGGEGGFSERKTIDKLFNCGANEENAYIAEANNPIWKINKPILEMFSSEHLRKILEKAIIMNVMYFNSQRVSSLEKYDKNSVTIATKFCIEKTKEFIEIIKPKAVLLLGMKAPKWLGVRFSLQNSILQSVDNKPTTNMIWKVENNGIPYYIIHHPSPSTQTVRFNFGENRVNLLAKKAKFEEIFSKGNDDCRTEEKYNDAGVLIEKKYFSDNKLHQQIFNEFGNQLESNMYKDGQLESSIKTEYDDRQRYIKTTVSYPNGDIRVCRYFYQNDDDTKEYKLEDYMNGQLKEVWIYERDEEGNLCRSIKHNASGQIEQEYIRNKNGKMIEDKNITAK